MSKNRRRWRYLQALLLAAGLLWVASEWRQRRRDRSAFAEIEAEMNNGRFGIAARKLSELLPRRPVSDQAAYLLGTCEKARGRYQAATEAWARVTPGSEFSYQAVQARMRLAEDIGRFADAERLVNEAAQDPRSERTELLVMLVPLFSQLGRLDEAERLVEARWEHLKAIGEETSERAIFQLRLHIVLTVKPNSVANVRAYLDRAFASARDDDRIWLGRANLAIRTGNVDEAKRWLDACLERRPDDVSVWRARLNWAMASKQVDVVRQAFAHIPAADSTPAQLHRVSAWLFSHQGDMASERLELERLVAVDPGDLTALDRLIRLAEHDRQPDRAAQFCREKAAIEGVRARYEKLYDRKQPIRHAVEMASLAERLGRTFGARAFLTLAIAEDPEREGQRRDLARLLYSPPAIAGRAQTLAEALAHALGDVKNEDAKD